MVQYYLTVENALVEDKVFHLKNRLTIGRTSENDIKLLLLENNFLVNCLQRASAVVIQKSIKEGFGLTVSEALYKGTPVVASKVGGILAQVVDGQNGFLHDPKDYAGFSNSILRLLKDQSLREELGKNGREYVRKRFLVTRLVSDWLNLFESVLNKRLSGQTYAAVKT